MEKQDLSKLLIKDSEYYNPNSTYVNMLKRNNIVTINQLLTDNFWNIYWKKCQGDTRLQLTGLISMLKYKYLGETLLLDEFLDKYIDLDRSIRNTICIKSNTKNEYIYYDKTFGCRTYEILFLNIEFIKYLESIGIYNINESFNEDIVKLIDFFKWILLNEGDDRFKYLIPYARTYVESYEQHHICENNNLDAINYLKGQLHSLLKIRKDLNEQIIQIQNQIESLSYNKIKVKNK